MYKKSADVLERSAEDGSVPKAPSRRVLTTADGLGAWFEEVSANSAAKGHGSLVRGRDPGDGPTPGQVSAEDMGAWHERSAEPAANYRAFCHRVAPPTVTVLARPEVAIASFPAPLPRPTPLLRPTNKRKSKEKRRLSGGL